MPKTNIHVVIDQSASMESIKRDTIKSFNSYLSDRQEENPDAKMSLTLFNTHSVTTLFNEKKVKDIMPLSDREFRPAGSTPLYDAIGKAARDLSIAKGKNKVLVIITDGQENASREFNQGSVRKLLSDKQELDNWLVLFLAANIDARTTGTNLGIMPDFSLQYTASGLGATASFAAASGATTRYLKSGGSRNAASFTTEERSSSIL